MLIPASSGLAAEVYIPGLNAKPGETIDVPIMIDRVDNLAGIKLVMKYDPKVLKYLKGEKTKHTGSLMHIINDKKPGLLIAVMAGARGIKGKDFPILRLSFGINKSLKGNHNTNIEITEIEMMSDQLKNIEVKTKSNPIIVNPK